MVSIAFNLITLPIGPSMLIFAIRRLYQNRVNDVCKSTVTEFNVS